MPNQLIPILPIKAAENIAITKIHNPIIKGETNKGKVKTNLNKADIKTNQTTIYKLKLILS